MVNPVTGAPDAVPFVYWKGRMNNLGTLGGTQASAADGNDRGEVAGQSNLKDDTTFHPFFWSAKRGMVDLGSLGGVDGYANWINNKGHVVGVSTTTAPCTGCGLGDQVHLAFLWRNGRMINLGHVKGDRCSTGYGINSKDQVVGASGICHGGVHGFLWQNGHMFDLNTLISPPASGLRIIYGIGINNRGDIVGTAVLPSGAQHVVLLVPRK